MTPKRRFCSEVVVGPPCALTTTSMLVSGSVGVDAQLLLMSSTSSVREFLYYVILVPTSVSLQLEVSRWLSMR